MTEEGVVFHSENRQLIAVEHRPTIKPLKRGVIIVVGGPQTRVGSHRLFVDLARTLVKQGITVFRFDYSGAGDSEGKVSTFTEIQEDIHAAIKTFQLRHHHIEEISLWGLCDAASAILLYLTEYRQPEIVKRLLLVNPWVRQTHTQAKTYLQAYYVKRFFSKAFWLKLLSGKIQAQKAYQEIQNFHQNSKNTSGKQKTETFIKRMFDAIKQFNGQITIVLSGNDLTANEFLLLEKENKAFRKIIACDKVTRKTIPYADHTFSQQETKNQLFNMTFDAIMK